jgi:hypothetical protein
MKISANHSGTMKNQLKVIENRPPGERGEEPIEIEIDAVIEIDIEIEIGIEIDIEIEIGFDIEIEIEIQLEIEIKTQTMKTIGNSNANIENT